MITCHQRVIDTYLPLVAWCFRQLLGPKYGKLMARALYPAPASIKSQFAQDFSELDDNTLHALESSSYRRRLRRAYKEERRPGIKAQAKRCVALSSFLDNACEDARRQGHEPTWDNLPKLCDLEEEYRARTEEIVAQQEELARAFLPTKRRLLEIGGIENYRQELASLVFELRAAPHDLELSQWHRSDIAKMVLKLPGFNKIADDKATDREKAEAILSTILNLASDERSAEKLVRKIIWALSTEDIFGRGSAGPYGREHETFCETPIDDLRWEDTLPDLTYERQFAEIESREEYEILLQDLPAAQRRAVQIYKESEETGMPVRHLCRDERDYMAVRQAFQEVKKRHRQ